MNYFKFSYKAVLCYDTKYQAFKKSILVSKKWIFLVKIQNTEILSKNTGIQNIFLISNTKYRNTKYRNTKYSYIWRLSKNIKYIWRLSKNIAIFGVEDKKILIYLLFSINCQITPKLSILSNNLKKFKESNNRKSFKMY